MKRVGHLYEKVMDYDNIVAAMVTYDRNRPRKLQRGVDYRLAWELLEEMRRDFAGVIGKPRIKYIHEGGKERRLQVPSYRSCIAQIALWNVCGPYVERRIHDQSFSSRKGKGGHLAARKCERFVHTHLMDGAKHHLYFDVKKYYQHIDKRILMARLETIFKDRRVLDLFWAVIDSADEGLPIGYPFSHALANLYLVPLYFLLRGEKNVSKVFVYMDNWIVFSRFKKPLFRCVEHAKNWLAGVGCSLKGDWQVAPTAKRPVRMCGFVIGSGPTRLYRGIWHRIVRNADRFATRRSERLNRSLMSRLGWVKAINVQYAPCFFKRKEYVWLMKPRTQTKTT